jgi:hypothetical protein
MRAPYPLARLQTVRQSRRGAGIAHSAQLDINEIRGVRNPTHAPATTSESITYKTRPATVVADRALFPVYRTPRCLLFD